MSLGIAMKNCRRGRREKIDICKSARANATDLKFRNPSSRELSIPAGGCRNRERERVKSISIGLSLVGWLLGV